MVKRTKGMELASLTLQNIPSVKLKAKTDLANLMKDKPEAKKDSKDNAPTSQDATKTEAPEAGSEGADEGCTAAPGSSAAGGSLLWALLLASGLVWVSRRSV
ncbi:MAG: hypothetical protein AAFX99_26460 [Myxococcota bacterium]